MARKVLRDIGEFNARTTIKGESENGKTPFVSISNNYRSRYNDGKDAYFLDVKNEYGEEVYITLDEQDMIELFKGFVEIAQWYKDKGFEVGI